MATKKPKKAAIKSRSGKETYSANLSPVVKSICEKFKQTRKEAGLTQEQFALSLGTNRVYVNAVELGKQPPHHDMILLWADKYKRDINWIYGRTKQVSKLGQ
jgi:DNA-binding XRE family transcriptional regulator